MNFTKLILALWMVAAGGMASAAQNPIGAANSIYQNILSDPGFENGGYGWTASGGATKTANTTAKGTGSKGYDWDSNAASQTLDSAAVTIPDGLKGKNGYALCNIKTPSGTATHTITAFDGSSNIVTPQSITSSATTFAPSGVNFIFPSSGTLKLRLTSVASNEPEIYIDDCYVGLATNIANGIPTNTYTAVVGNSGNVAQETGGDWINGACSLSTNFFTCTYNSGIFNNAPNCTATVNESSTSGAVARTVQISDASTTAVKYLTAQQSSGSSTASPYSVYLTCTKTGADFIQPVIIPAQFNYDWTSYTPTIGAGAGTATAISFQHRRQGSNLIVKGRFTAGTTAASLVTISLPGSLALDTTKITASNTSSNPGEMVGNYSGGTSAGHAGPVVTATGTSTSLVYFGNIYGGSTILTPTNGSSGPITTSEIQSVYFTVPIAGWFENQNAPALTGSITSSTGGIGEHVASARLTCGNSSSAVVNNPDGSISSMTNGASAGLCTANFATSYFSAEPHCTCTTVAATTGGGNPCDITANATTSSVSFSRHVGLAVANGDIYLWCKGPR